MVLRKLTVKLDHHLFLPKKLYKDIKEIIMPDIMTTREIAGYLKLHEITICKLAGEGKIPAFRIGRSWRFDKDAIDEWINKGGKQ